MFWVTLFAVSWGQRATSFDQMEKLFLLEQELMNRLQGKLDQKVKNLEWLEGKMKSFENERQGGDLNHPVNQFKLIRRFAKDWHNVASQLPEETNDITEDIKESTAKVLATNSNRVAENGILRLQETYFLSASDLQQGLPTLSPDIQAPHLTAQDCYDLGRRAYMNEGSMSVVKDWMKLALRLADREKDFDLQIEALDHLAYATSKLGDQRGAYVIYKKLSELKPEEKRYRSNLQYYHRVFIDKTKGETEADGLVFSKLSTSAADHRPERYETEYYESLCRLPLRVPKEKAQTLKCFLWDNNHPYLILGPIKTEQLWDEPEIVRFHEIITNEEMEIIKRLALPLANLATVQDPLTGKLVNADYRISDSAWLKSKTDSVDDQKLRQFRRRISIITGLTMERAEEIQYSNYGIGGQYEPHFDHSTENDVGDFDEEDGNRIATWLTYLNEPVIGGDTAFLSPGIKAAPVARSAVFWYNLLRDGSSDKRTRHAACPVLIGQKAVSNIWLHERGEEFTRKCLLTQTDISTIAN